MLLQMVTTISSTSVVDITAYLRAEVTTIGTLKYFCSHGRRLKRDLKTHRVNECQSVGRNYILGSYVCWPFFVYVSTYIQH